MGSTNLARYAARIGAGLVLLAGLLLADAAAAVREFYFARLGSERGLANAVTALRQDRQGFVWVGTQGGLHRFDGQRYVAYRHDPRDPASLPESFVTALELDGEHGLWVGTQSQYVARLDLRDGRVTRLQPAAGGYTSRQVRALLAQERWLWVATLSGLERIEIATGTRRRLLTLPSETLRLNPLAALLPDGADAVWYASHAGVYRVTDVGVQRISARPARSLLRDRRGRLWIGMADGLYRLERTGLTRRWPLGEEPAQEARWLAEAPDGRLWFATAYDGLRRYDPASGRVEAVRAQRNLDASLPENSASALMIDHGGMLWVGGQLRGVAVTDPRGARFVYAVDDTGSRRNAYDGDSVRALLQDAAGALWIATDEARLLRYDLASAHFEDMSEHLPRGAAGGPLRVAALAPAPDGGLWLGSFGGLLWMDPRTLRVRAVELGAHGRPAIRSLRTARDGSLWIGTDQHGALHYRPGSGSVTHYPYREGGRGALAHPTVHAILEDRRGRVWLGTGDGLALIERAGAAPRLFRHAVDDPLSLAGNLVRALHESADGTLWIGTHTGLSQLQTGADGRVQFTHPLAEAAGGNEPAPVVFTILEAPAGRLWLGTDGGIVRLDRATGHVRRYGLADGLQDLEFNGGAATALADGRLVLGGVRGVNLFDPRRVGDSAYVPPLRVLAVSIGATAPHREETPWQISRIEVPDGDGLLRLRVGALDFAPAARIRYRYRMDGYDLGWIDNGERPDITYTRLPPGRYTLRVQATNRDGVWSSTELRMPVHVAPPWWRHPVALLVFLGLAAAALATLGLNLHRRRQLERDYFRQIREREERLKLALWGSGEQFFDYDLRSGEVHRMRVHDQSGTPEIAVLTSTMENREIHPDDAAAVAERLQQHLAGEAPEFVSEHRVRGREGKWCWVRTRGRVVERDADGRALRVAGTVRDITLSRREERDRRIATEVLRSMAEAVVVIDLDYRFVSSNPAFSRMTGYSEDEIIGKPAALLDSSQHEPGFYLQIRADLVTHGHWAGELWQRRKDGSEFLCWLQTTAVHDSEGRRTHYVAVLSDITEQKRTEQELRYLANYDTLTNLPNRTLLAERLSRAIVRARRHGHRVAVLFLDLDRFKDINDSLGHATGDRILRATAARLQQALGPPHTVARLGGDEFTVVLENLQTPEEAERIANELLRSFEEPLSIDNRLEVSMSPSIGIALYPDHAQVPTDLLKYADTAMYQAKAAGRRTYMRYTEAMDLATRRRATIAAALRNVLDRNELRLVFQPKLDLASGRITGVEALLRWNSPEHGDIPPAIFVPLAEENGLILEIGQWALREACHVLRYWRQLGLDDLTVAVNVSALQLQRGSMADTVATTLAESGLPAECLELELTETVLMANAEQNAVTLQRFRHLGVGLAIDDFGTGYSSLAYLKRLPINTLKIDKAFIGDLTTDPEDEAITATVIAMAHSLGLKVIAEGVETRAQLEFLRQHGCHEVQGFWISEPLEAAQCLAFLRNWKPAAAAALAPA
ncbi:EAL domain-containing protein [Vulcaniibacterium thermophilum]|nr:EAL domain-containing protein [Vulcaniibacterium thermophilum]